ncbi:MAG TPA: response regulator transcription factor [Baekduia sp.]|nr:response regulator transcription factor [Baekduia sp.]
MSACSPAPVRVVVADHHLATRAGIRAALEAGGMDVVAEAGSPGATVAAVVEHRPDVALVDLTMPPGDVLAAITRMGAQVPETLIIILTGSSDPAHLLGALRAGARGYLLKDTDPDRLPLAVAGALRGEAAIPRTLVPTMVEEIARLRIPRRSGPLSDREHEVMAALARGSKTDEVARELGVAGVTVRRHLSSAAGKLGARGREEALTRFRALDDHTTE